MNILIFCLTILALYGIINYAITKWNEADTVELTDTEKKMKTIKEVEKEYKEVQTFKKSHRGNIDYQKETIKQFNKEQN